MKTTHPHRMRRKQETGQKALELTAEAGTGSVPIKRQTATRALQ